MIIDDLDLRSTSLSPPEAKPRLIVDANAVLDPTVADQHLQAIAGYQRKIGELDWDIECPQPAPGKTRTAHLLAFAERGACLCP